MKNCLELINFLLLSHVQNFVASIVSDPNVLNAVMQNPVLQELLESNQKSKSPKFKSPLCILFESSSMFR